jgi:hypothetical protein
MSRKALYIQVAVSLTALSFVELFALWWFNPQNIPHNFTGWATIFDIVLYLLVSYVIWHPIFMEVVTWILSSTMKTGLEQSM